MSEPVLETIGKGTSVAIRGPIDIYNEVFLNTLTDSNVVKQLRVELIDEKEIEIPVVAGQLAANANGRGAGGEGRREPPPPRMSSCSRPPRRAPSRPGAAWPARAPPGCCWPTPTTPTAFAPRGPTSSSSEAWARCPFVVASYMSMTGEELTPKQVAKALGLDAKTPVLPCHLRDRESVAGVVQAALELAAANAGA